MKILNNIIFTHTFSLACLVFKRLIDKPWENWAWESAYILIAVYCALIILISILEQISTPSDELKTDIPLYFRSAAKTASLFICISVLLMNILCYRGGNIYALICLCAAAAASVKLLLIKESIKAEFKNKESTSI